MGCLGFIIKAFIYYLIWNFWVIVSSIPIVVLLVISVSSELDEEMIFFKILSIPCVIFIMIFPFYIMTRKWHKRNLRKIFSSKNWGLALFAVDTPIPVEKNNSYKDLSKDK